MEGKKKNTYAYLTRINECIESTIYPSLVRVLREAQRADAINHSHKFRQIFMNRLAEDLWNNNPLHPERGSLSVCNMPFNAVSSGGLRPPSAFSWGMSRNRAATIIQVFTIQITCFQSTFRRLNEIDLNHNTKLL